MTQPSPTLIIVLTVLRTDTHGQPPRPAVSVHPTRAAAFTGLRAAIPDALTDYHRETGRPAEPLDNPHLLDWLADNGIHVTFTATELEKPPMSEPNLSTLRTVSAYRYDERLLCPTCVQAAVLPLTVGAEYDDTEHVLDVVAADRGIDRATTTSEVFPVPITEVEALRHSCQRCGSTLLDGDYWTVYDAALDAIAAEADTVEALIAVLNRFYPPQVGAAFHPGGADRTLRDVLRWERTDWTTVWSKASYWYAMRDSEGNTFTYTEGDIERGSQP